MPPRFGSWYYGWTVVAVCMLFEAIIYGITFYSYTLYASAWLADPVMNVSNATVVLGGTLLMLFGGFMSPWLGRAVDRYSIRHLICIGALVAALSMALVSFSTAFWQILVIYACLLPLGFVLSGPLAAQTLVAKWFDGRRGTAMGIVTTGTSIGGFTVPVIIAYLFAETGWRTAHLIIAAAVVLLIIPPVLLFIRNSPKDLGLAPDPPVSPRKPVALQRTSSTPHLWTTKTILTEPNFWVICAVTFILAAGFTGISVSLSQFATDLDIPQIHHGYLISIYAGTMIPAKIVFGLLSDRLDVRLLLWAATASLGLSTSLLLLADSFLVLAIACVFLGMASGSMLPLLGNLVSSRFGAHAFGRVMGMLGPFNASAGIAPVAVGAIRDSTGSYEGGWLLILSSLLPAALTAAFLDRIGRSRRRMEARP